MTWYKNKYKNIIKIWTVANKQKCNCIRLFSRGWLCQWESSLWGSDYDILKLGLQEKYRRIRMKIFIVIFIVSCWQDPILGAYLDLLNSFRLAQWLRLAHSNGPNWVGASPIFHLRKEMDPFPKTCSVQKARSWMKS